MSTKYMIVGSVIIGLVAVAYLITAIMGLQTNEVQNIQEPAQNFRSVSTGSTGAGDVSIELTPRYNDGLLEVDLRANTHSVDLSQFDLQEITTLEYGGRRFTPTAAPSFGGHHVSGTLVFEVGAEQPSFVIRMKGIPAVEERVFAWGAE